MCGGLLYKAGKSFSLMLIEKLKRVKNQFLRRCKPKSIQQYLAPFPVNLPSGNSGKTLKINRPVVIFGTMRTGSTLIMDMLSSHPELIATTGSPEREDVVMWIELGGASMSAIGNSRSVGPLGHFFCAPMDGTDISSERVSFFHRGVIRRYPQLKDRKLRLLNANTHLSNKLSYVKRILPDASLILLVRNPYAVIASLKEKLASRKDLMFEIPNSLSTCINVYPKYGWDSLPSVLQKQYPNIYNPGNPESICLLARYWKNTVLYAQKQRDDLDGISFLTIRYEDIVNDYKNTLSDIMRYCGLKSFNDWKVLPRDGVNQRRLEQLCDKEIALIRDEIGEVAESFGYKHP